MNTVVITGSGPVACPGFFHFGPLRTALVEARRVVLVHAWNYSANKDLKRFLRRDEIRVLDTVSIERFVSFTDVTHAVTLHGESEIFPKCEHVMGESGRTDRTITSTHNNIKILLWGEPPVPSTVSLKKTRTPQPAAPGRQVPLQEVEHDARLPQQRVDALRGRGRMCCRRG
jgi:hypothetical protein